MYKWLLLSVFAILLFAGCSEKQPVDYVDPFIGTDFHGHTYPGATVPFGEVQLSPDTRRGNWDACSGYHYSDSTILGFSHTHLSGTGGIDFGDLLFHPYTGTFQIKNGEDIFDAMPFSHSNESAQAGYYSVKLNNGIKVELTAGQHTGVHRYTFPGGEKAGLIIDLAYNLDNEIINSAMMSYKDQEVSGMRVTSGWVTDQHIYFVARFSQPFELSYVSDGQKINNTSEAKGTRIQALLSFTGEDAKPLVVKVGISQVSIENARMNLDAEMNDFDFDAFRTKAKNQWNEALSAYKVTSKNEDNLKTFYTSLYHTMVTPNLTSDVNGDYRGPDHQTHKNALHKTYSTMSLWDTFRAWNPLVTLADTTLVNNIVNSCLDFYDQSGELPIWPLASGETYCMIGYHSVSVIYDAYSKGIRGYDVEKAFQAMKVSADKNNKATTPFLDLGYIPADKKRQSVSCLLENAYDDWCIAQMAKALGHDDDYKKFTDRSLLYKNVFDGQSRFFRARMSDGMWVTPFNPFEVNGTYTEATAWQYRFFVPHDINGLVNLLGGEKYFNEALDSLFTVESKFSGEQSDITGMIGQYAHGNEPSHHMAYLYCYSGQPWKTQELTRRILKEMYKPTNDGISGNEDCGQMSAWYVLSSLGIYSVCPGTTEFILTTPLFDRAVIRMASGKELEITANNPEKNIYIKEVYLNGNLLKKNSISYAQMMAGGQLKFVLDNKPNTQWGINEDARPYSESSGKEVSVPFVSGDISMFFNNVQIKCGITTPGASIHYTLDGTDPTESSPVYQTPFSIDKTTVIKLRAFCQGMAPGKIATYKAVKGAFIKPSKSVMTQNGIDYLYYEGDFSKTGDILTKGRMIKKATCTVPTNKLALRPDGFAMIFSGYIFAPADGVYSFYLSSDDGSVLKIAGQEVVNNDGSHSNAKASGRIALMKGYYPFELRYFDGGEEDFLEMGWRVPGSSEDRIIEPGFFYCK
jgi:predicted alpha-1,2-mannosidase